MKTILFFLLSFPALANFNIGGYTKLGVYFTKNQEPSSSCEYKGRFSFTSSVSAKDEERLAKETKRLGGNYLLEDSAPGIYSRQQGGRSYYCPGL